MSARALAVSLLDDAGFADLLRFVRRVTRREGRALILMYHRVSPEPDYLGLSVSPAHFDRQLGLLGKHADVLPLEQLVSRVASGEPLERDIAAVTFDDGYRDNLETALPILERHGVPATVFVTTDFIDGISRPVGERVRDAFETLWRLDTRPHSWPGIGNARADDLVRTALARPGSLPTLAALAFSLPNLEAGHVEALLETLERLAGKARDGSSLMLDWPGVRALATRNVEVGSHTVSHPILSRIPRDRAEREVVESKARIEREIGRPVVSFAFPNGRAEDFTDADLECLRRAGYRCSCTAERGVNVRGGDPYRLLRIGVGDYGTQVLDLKLALGR